MLVFAMHHNESVTNIYIYNSPPSWTSLPSPTPPHSSRLLQSTGLSSLLYTANSHWPSILHMVINMCLCYSLSSFHPLPPMDTEIVAHIYNGILKKKRMHLSPNEVDEPRAYVQSEVSQKEKDKYCTLTHRYRI